MTRGDIVRFQPGVAIWDVKSSPSSVIGRTDEKSIYIFLGISIFLDGGNDEVQVLCPCGLVGWVSSSVIRN